MAHDKTKNENDPENTEAGTDTATGNDPSETKDTPEVCRNFLNNRCNRGNDCKYHHPKDAETHRDSSRNRRKNRSRSRSRNRGSRHRSRSPVRDVCRDFERGLCDRGSACRYYHPDDRRGTRAPKQKGLEVCRSFLKGDCSRKDCRYLHVSQDDEDLFKQSGDISNNIINQAVDLTLDSSISINNGKPVCRRFINGDCREPCKFQHMALNDLERQVCGLILSEFEKQFGTPMQQPSLLGPGGLLGNFGQNFGGGGGGGNMSGMGMSTGLNNFGGGGTPWDNSSMNRFDNPPNNFGGNNTSFGNNFPGNMGGPDMGGSMDDMQLLRDNRNHLETIQLLQREIKDMGMKVGHYQKLDEELRQAKNTMQISENEKLTLKDAMRRSEEMMNHFKGQVQTLTDEMKSADSGKLELGILARKVLGDWPAMEARLIPSWTGGTPSSEVRHWQTAAQNVRSLIQNILGLNSVNTESVTSGSVGLGQIAASNTKSKGAYNSNTASRFQDDYGTHHAGDASGYATARAGGTSGKMAYDPSKKGGKMGSTDTASSYDRYNTTQSTDMTENYGSWGGFNNRYSGDQQQQQQQQQNKTQETNNFASSYGGMYGGNAWK